MKKILGLLVFIAALTANAQTIDAQFDSLRAKSNNYKEYKVVPRAGLIKLQKATDARINGLKDSISALTETIEKKDAQINQLNSNLSTTEQEKETAIAAKETLNVLGSEINKGLYSTIVWTIIAVLVILLVIVLVKYRSNQSAANDARLQLNTTEQELEDLRRKSIEEQQRLGRQLQDERNKLARLKNQ